MSAPWYAESHVVQVSAAEHTSQLASLQVAAAPPNKVRSIAKRANKLWFKLRRRLVLSGVVFFVLIFPPGTTNGVKTFAGNVASPPMAPLPTSVVGQRDASNPLFLKTVLPLRSDNCAAGVSAGLGHVLCGQLLAYFGKGLAALNGGALKPCIVLGYLLERKVVEIIKW